MKPGLRERKRELTRRTIWQSAMRLFTERGYDEVTIEEIADVCVLSPRTIFRYFGTKEDVLFAGGETRRAGLLAAIEAQPADASPFEVLRAASRSVAEDHFFPDRDLLRARAEIVETAPSLRSRNAGLPEQWDREVMKLLRSSGRAGTLDDFELQLLVGTAMTALRVCIEVWITTDADLFELIESAFDGLGNGLATQMDKKSAAANRPQKRSKATR